MKRELPSVGEDVAAVFESERVDKLVADRQFGLQVVGSGHLVRDAFHVNAVTGPADLEVTVGERSYHVEMELFRAENRYVSAESISMMSGTEFPDESR